MESSFQTAICDCSDINASTMAVDVTGRYVMITGRKSMGLIDLDYSNNTDETSLSQETELVAPQRVTSPKTTPVCKKFVRNSKYEPTVSQFNKHIVDLFAVTTYQMVEIFSVDDLNPLKPKILLRGHSRAISDIGWSHFDPHLLGSSAADCLTNLWDIRDSRRPTACLTSVSGATQVRFSKTSSNLIATGHDIDVRIWDIRQPSLPLYYIAAHLQKINDMDWNPGKINCDLQSEQLITCSQDNTIKLWELRDNKISPTANLPTRMPAWRIKCTPVSPNAMITSSWPQLRSRSECTALKLWSIKPNRYEQKKLELILTLVGHTDVIVDFDWRPRPSSGASEIVSWSKDQTLRVWRVDNQFIEMNVENSDFETECEVADQACESIDATSLLTDNKSTSRLSTGQIDLKQSETSQSSSKFESPVRSSKIAGVESDNKQDRDDSNDEDLSTTNELRQEFNLINKNISNLEFEELNPLRRVCLVTARAKNLICRLRIALPPSYPNNECPVFTIIDSNQYGSESLTKEAKEKLLNLLNETAKSQLSRGTNCLEPCLRKFTTALQKITSHNSYRKRAIGTNIDPKEDPITLSAQKDHSVPFPPTSGARFCGNLLVCFGRPVLHSLSAAGGESANWLVETPRSMAQLSAQLDNMRRQGSYNLSHISISYFYYGAVRRAELQSRSGKSSTASSRASSKYLASRNKSLHSSSIMSKSYKCGPVLIYDVTVLLGGLCRELAENYVFDKDVIKMCRRNAEIAASHNRKDLIQIWSLAELSSEGVLRSYIPNKYDESEASLVSYDSDFGDRPWTMHPFGSKLIQSLIDHYVNNCHDVQTAAMLIWTFSSPKLGQSVRLQNSKFSSSNPNKTNPLSNALSNYSVLSGLLASTNKGNNNDAISDEWNFVNGPETHLYSNSWSNSTINEHDNQSNDLKRSQQAGSEEKFPKLNILSPTRSLQNDFIMHIYAELLYRLNLLNQRAMVLKNIGSNSSYSEIFGDKQALNDTPEERSTNLTIQCYNLDCRSKCHSVQCENCKKYSLYCSICRLPVKGSCSICLKCLHGGHVSHFDTWFQAYDFCPTGCGCKCLS